jgi:hypothetical protein
MSLRNLGVALLFCTTYHIRKSSPWEETPQVLAVHMNSLRAPLTTW